MKISMRKVSSTPKDVALNLDGINLEGQIYRLDSQLLCLKCRIYGDLELICDISGEEFLHKLDEHLVLYISDGIWDTQSQNKRLESFEVIEFFDGFVDLHYILESEIESIRSDYHTKD